MKKTKSQTPVPQDHEWWHERHRVNSARADAQDD